MTGRSWPRRHTVVMSCAAEIVADPAVTAAALDAAVERLHELEACWSRFDPSSDISRINDSDGTAVRVDPSTLTLLAAMASGTTATGGAFDPSVLDVMVGFGRGASYVEPASAGSRREAPVHGSWFDDIQVDPLACTVLAPAGRHLDPGGIGKGLAADLVVDELLAAGSVGAMVSLGGDVRVGGRSPSQAGWCIDIGAVDRDAPAVERIRLGDGAVATSGTTRRRLRDSDGEAIGHVIDPATRRPARREIVQVSVAAGTGAWAEVMTKAVLVAGPGAVDVHDLAAMWIGLDGVQHCTDAWEALR